MWMEVRMISASVRQSVAEDAIPPGPPAATQNPAGPSTTSSACLIQPDSARMSTKIPGGKER